MMNEGSCVLLASSMIPSEIEIYSFTKTEYTVLACIESKSNIIERKKKHPIEYMFLGCIYILDECEKRSLHHLVSLALFGLAIRLRLAHLSSGIVSLPNRKSQCRFVGIQVALRIYLFNISFYYKVTTILL